MAVELGVASLVTLVAGGPAADSTGTESVFEATIVPLILDGDRLLGHVARANSIWKNEGPVLAIFTGPSDYVSPSWYPSKKSDGKAVPTWNYVTVMMHGSLAHHDDALWKRDVVGRLSVQHESRLRLANAEHDSWSIDDAPPEYIENLLKSIVGIEIAISRIEGKAKLSQNRPSGDQDGVVAALSNEALALAMRASKGNTVQLGGGVLFS